MLPTGQCNLRSLRDLPVFWAQFLGMILFVLWSLYLLLCWLCQVFVAARALLCWGSRTAGLLSDWGVVVSQRPPSIVVFLTEQTRRSSRGSWALAHRLSSHMLWALLLTACGILGPGMEPASLHWQVDSHWARLFYFLLCCLGGSR